MGWIIRYQGRWVIWYSCLGESKLTKMLGFFVVLSAEAPFYYQHWSWDPFRWLLFVLISSMPLNIFSPKSVIMIRRIKGVQWCATRLLSDRSQLQRALLNDFDLLPLSYRREVKDLTTFYKLKCGHFNCSFSSTLKSALTSGLDYFQVTN